jgi:hypothetical protein
VFYVYSGGYELCAEHAEDLTDPNNESGEAMPIFEWDEAASELLQTKEEEHAATEAFDGGALAQFFLRPGG